MLENPIAQEKDKRGFDQYREELTRQGRLPASGAPERKEYIPERRPSERVNILWLMTDQLRADTLGFAGHPLVRTPNLDRLAARGTVFHRSYCNSPVCGPARASMITGRRLNDHGVLQNNFRMHDDETPLTHLFAEAGYRTACLGKTHCGRQGVWEYSKGVEDCFGATMPTSVAYDPEIYPDAIYLHYKTCNNPNNVICGTYPGPAPTTKSYRLATEGMKWIYYNNDPRPFFLRISLDDPHPPIVPPEPYISMYDPDEMPDELFVQARESLESKPRVLREFSKWHGSAPITEADHRKHAAAYLGLITHLDAQLGRFMEYFERSEFADNTIIVFNSDHGHYIGEHGLACKGVGMHEGVSRIPTFISWPGHLPEGRTSEALIEGTDLLPTLMELAGIPVPTEHLRGKSLVPVLEGRQEKVRDEVFLQWSDFGFGIVTDQWKVTWYLSDDEGELYDLKNDPWEKINLYHDPHHQATRDRLLEILHTHRNANRLPPVPKPRNKAAAT